jgi:hypothetical protein
MGGETIQVLVSLVVLLGGAGAVRTAGATPESPPAADCCGHEELEQTFSVIWTGMDRTMTIEPWRRTPRQ